MSREFAIAEARDFTMFRSMIGVVAFLLSIVTGMLGFMWKDLSSRLDTYKVEIQYQQDKVAKEIWEAINECCPRSPVIHLPGAVDTE